jgi:hypothetical protein
VKRLGAVCACLFATAFARADLATSLNTNPIESEVRRAPDGIVQPGAVGLLPMSSLAPAPAPPENQAYSITGGPDSAALFLWALGGVGIWQVSRNSRKIHLGHFPEWYHAGAPQVGHTAPFDLDFSRSALVACVFDEPVLVKSPRREAAEILLHPAPGCLRPCLADPRGPPCVA